jgi:hypothetical protein
MVHRSGLTGAGLKFLIVSLEAGISTQQAFQLAVSVRFWNRLLLKKLLICFDDCLNNPRILFRVLLPFLITKLSLLLPHNLFNDISQRSGSK